MASKVRVLVPGAAAAAAMTLLVACPSLPPPPPDGSTTTSTATTVQQQPACPSTPHSAAGPDNQDPISSWGVNDTAVTTVVIGDVVYVGGTFTQAVAPNGQSASRANLAAFCLADGSLLASFVANVSGTAPMSPAKPTEVWALTTDGTNLFVGGNFNAINGTAVQPLAKLDPVTGAVLPFNPGPIPDLVYALDYFGGRIYAGGDFSLAGNIRKGASFDSGTGAVGTWNPGIDGTGRIESLKVTPSGQWVYIGGAFQSVQGQAHDKLAKLARTDATVQPVVYGNAAPGVIGARVLDIAVNPNNEDQVFVALGPKAGTNPPPPNGAGNRFVAFNANGQADWDDNGPDGDGQAVELIGSILYAGFHGGWNGDPSKRLLGLTASTGATTAFAPATNGILGVFDLAQAASSGRLVAVGDFKDMGSTHNLHGVAIFD